MRLPADLRRAAREFLGGTLDLILPLECLGCGKPSEELCGDCARDLRGLRGDGCDRCGAALTPEGRCIASHLPLCHLDQLMAPYAFAGTGGRLVRKFKLDGNVAAGRRLARAMADRFHLSSLTRRPILVPVPLHRQRRWQRGFDQASWLASRLGRLLGLRVVTAALARQRATRPQGDPTVLSRAANVRGVFAVADPHAVRSRHVLLIDDVFTTGATSRECATLLRDAGARGVSLLVACRSRTAL